MFAVRYSDHLPFSLSAVFRRTPSWALSCSSCKLPTLLHWSKGIVSALIFTLMTHKCTAYAARQLYMTFNSVCQRALTIYPSGCKQTVSNWTPTRRSSFDVLLHIVGLSYRDLHLESGLMPSFRLLWFSTSQSTLILTSACGLTSSRLSLSVLLFYVSCVVSGGQFHRLFSRPWSLPLCWPDWITATRRRRVFLPSCLTVYSLCSTRQLSLSPVFVARLT